MPTMFLPVCGRALLVIGVLGGLLTADAAAQVSVPGNYPTIQSAINAVTSGALPSGTTINVQPGTYFEALVVANTSRSFTVRGVSGASATVVDAAGRGAAAINVFRATGTIAFTGLTFRNGTPPTAAGGGFVIQESSPSFTNCTFESNRANFGGGGTLIASNAVFTGCVIRNNLADRSGGGVYMVNNSRPVFTQCDIVNNRSGAGGPGVGNIGVGGGVDARDSSPTFRGSRISSNISTFAGGGLYHGGDFTNSLPTANLVIEDSEIADNVTAPFSAGDNPAEGGGIHIEDKAIAYLTRVRVLRNSANSGGGLSAYRSRYEIVDSAIGGNRATGRSDGGFGGGIYGHSTNVGTVRPSSIVNLTRSLVQGNVGITGGGLVVTGDVGRPATLTLTNSVVDGNQTQNQGGGILLSRADLTASGSMIIRNTVTGGVAPFGGGLLISTSSAATITGSTIAANTAGVYGGGIFMNEGAELNMTGSRIFGNTANNPTFSGGGLFIGNAGTNTGSVASSIIADNNGFQIFENGCPRTTLTYTNNTITPRAGSNDLYVSACSSFQTYTNIADFNALSNTSGNNSNLPRYSHFLAAPQAGTRFTLAWSVARATSVTIAGVGTFSQATGTVEVAPPASTTYSMTAAATSANGGNYSAVTAGVQVVPPPGAAVPQGRAVDGDFDGDGRSDTSVFRPSNGTWYFRSVATGATAQIQWGGSGDIVAPGDYDGDRRMDAAVFREATGFWYVRYSSTGASVGLQFGGAGDRIAPGDYDGDGRTDLAVFRPSNGTWYLRFSSTGATASFQWGGGSDRPVPADYDGDGTTDLAVFRPATGIWYLRYSSTGGSAGVQWGSGNDVPVPGDYDGDGRADTAVFRPADGTWYVRFATGASTGIQWGGSTDRPVPGDYDGDGRMDAAIFRPSTAVWYLRFSSTGGGAGIQWGLGGDVAVLQRP